MRAPSTRQAGFTYLGLLAAVVLMGLLLTMASRVWSLTEQSERETQLLFIGHAYGMAIASYFATGHQYPHALQDIVENERLAVPNHQLSRLYTDSVTCKADWSLIPTKNAQAIMAV